jgi:hypothetical protein
MCGAARKALKAVHKKLVLSQGTNGLATVCKLFRPLLSGLYSYPDNQCGLYGLYRL